MFLRLGGCVHGPPKPIILDFGDTKWLQIIQENPESFFGKCDLGKSQTFENRNFQNICKRRGPANPEDPSNKFSKILNMKSISPWIFCDMGSISVQKTWHENAVIWDQYQSKDMKWKFGHMGSLNLWNFETKNLWNQETKKPGNFQTKKPRHFFK